MEVVDVVVDLGNTSNGERTLPRMLGVACIPHICNITGCEHLQRGSRKRSAS